MHTNISTLFYNHLQNQNGHSICNNNGSKMVVEVAFEICSIGEIDTLNETFQAVVNIESKWTTTESFDVYEPSKHWNPMLYVDNALDVKETVIYEVAEENSLFRTVTEIRSIKGTFWERLDLEYFPFDVQELELVLTSKLGSDKLELVSDPHKLSYIAFEAKTRFKDQQKWRLFRFVTTSNTTCYENEKITKQKKCSHSLQEIMRHRNKFKPPKLVASCYSARRPGFYIINAFFLIFLITLISFTVFSIDINSPQFRLQSMFTILLAAISLKWAILKRLPSISYLTLLDLYQLSQFVFICMILSWHAVQASYFHTHNLDPTMMVFFLFLFFLKHILFVIWVYSINNKRRQLQKEEFLYFTRFKQHFIYKNHEDSV